MERPRVLSVGQCGFDSGNISRWFRSTFDAETVSVNTKSQALAALKSGSFGLVLVNRVGDSDGAPGLELIRAMKSDPALADSKVMLVSNFEAAQKQAIDLGALPGFGKSELGKPAMVERVRAALAGASQPSGASE